MEFGMTLRLLRHASGLSAEVFAERTGITKNMVYLYESGQCVPKLSTMLKMCTELNVTPNRLLGYDVEASLNEAQKQLDDISEQLGMLCDTLEYAQKKLNKLKGGE
ncbi:helix-turn-helix domain-containing protein [Ruminococcus callidus]|uniref:helix-turn-helix domain-containing protein n=1 Tax=Ruminococcus callidus TaxID=40519 RepID=UPI003522F5A4